MYLCFVDESGDLGLDLEKTTPYFMRVSIVCHESYWHTLSKIVPDVKKHWSIPKSTELHATEILSGKGFYKNFGIHKRIALFRDILKRIKSKQKIQILCVSLDKRDIEESKSTVDKQHFLRTHSWELLSEMFNKVIENQNIQLSLRDKGLIISDWCAQVEDSKAMEHLATVMEDPNSLIHRKNLIETITYADSSQSELLQLVDCIAYAIQRKFNHGQNKYFNMIKPKFFALNTEVDNHGLKLWDKPTPYNIFP